MLESWHPLSLLANEENARFRSLFLVGDQLHQLNDIIMQTNA